MLTIETIREAFPLGAEVETPRGIGTIKGAGVIFEGTTAATGRVLVDFPCGFQNYKGTELHRLRVM